MTRTSGEYDANCIASTVKHMKEVRNALPQKVYRNLIPPMPNRIQAVIAAMEEILNIDIYFQ